MSDLEEMENGIRIERLNAFSLISLSLSISSLIRLIYFNRGYMLNKEQKKAIRVERRRQMLYPSDKELLDIESRWVNYFPKLQ